MCVGLQPHVSTRFGASQFSAPDCCGAKKIDPSAGFKTWLERARDRVKAAKTCVVSEKTCRPDSVTDLAILPLILQKENPSAQGGFLINVSESVITVPRQQFYAQQRASADLLLPARARNGEARLL